MSPQAIANYEAILAAIGRHIDRAKWTQICIVELEGGILIQGTSLVPTSEAYAFSMHTEVLDQEALHQLVSSSDKRKGG
jgi:hypothetical protein